MKEWGEQVLQKAQMPCSTETTFHALPKIHSSKVAYYFRPLAPIQGKQVS